jgi:excisionase family DNA binding protein
MRTIHPDSARSGTPDGSVTGQAVPSPLAGRPEFLTVRELAKVLRIGRNQAYALVNTGQVAAFRFGGSIRVPKTAVQRLLDAPAVPAAGPE